MYLKSNSPQISKEVLSLEEEYTDIMLTITTLLTFKPDNDINIPNYDTLCHIVTHLPTLLWTYI